MNSRLGKKMADGEHFQPHCISMKALGRHFKLGNLYDYSNDSILENELLWQPAILDSATQVQITCEKRFEITKDADYNSNSKAVSVGLDKHLEMSGLCGLISDCQGASRYLYDKPNPQEATCTIVYRVKIREENLNLQSLVKQRLPYFQNYGNGDEQNEGKNRMEATHMVSSIFYGCEVYCVLAQEVDFGETDQKLKKETEDNLSTLADKWRDALNNFEDLAELTQRFNGTEKHLITRIKCRLYADFQTEPVLHCGFFEAYKQVVQLMKTICTFSEDIGCSKSVPIAILLCPLKFILDSRTNGKVSEILVDRYDAGRKLVANCCRVFADLQRIVIRAEAISSAKKGVDCSSLTKFVRSISNYQESLKAELKEDVLLTRKCSSQDPGCEKFFECFVLKADHNPIFKPSQLGKWLDYKDDELDMLDLVISKAGKGIRFLYHEKQLVEELDLDNFKYAIVLILPPLDERTNAIFEYMERIRLPFQDPEEKLMKAMDSLYEDGKKPSYIIRHRWKKLMLAKIGELTSHVEKNKHLEDQIQFLIKFCSSATTSDDDGKRVIRCRYSVYQGYKLLKANITRLPDPPTGLRLSLPATGTVKRAKTTSSPLRVEWDYEDPGYPYQFLMEYRLKGSSDSWIQLRTTEADENQMKINYEIGSHLEVRVAAETCIGRSDFSQVVDTESAEEEDVDCPKSVSLESISRKLPNGDQIETNSQDVQLSTAKKRFAKTLLTQGKKIGNENGLNLYAVPLSVLLGRPVTASQFVFGAPDVKILGKATIRRTILLVGSSDSGKTTLINAMINYVFGVRLKDSFRFRLIKDDGQKNRVDVYDLNHADGFRITYSLTIINTPSYVEEDYTRNLEITKIIRKFIDDKYGIQQVDMVGFVINSSAPQLTPLQLYIYCSLISVFGAKIRENVNFLLTSAEDENPSIWNSIVDYCLVTHGPLMPLRQNQHKFNSSVDFCSTEVLHDDFAPWISNIQNFFASLTVATASTKAISVSKQALDKKKRLKAVVYGLVDRIKTDLAKFQESRKIRTSVKNYWDPNLRFELDVTVAEQVSLPLGKYVTNCSKCRITCHAICGIQNGKSDCDVMAFFMPDATRTCLVCPGKCHWREHTNEPFRWKYFQEKRSVVLGPIMDKLKTELQKKGKPFTRIEVLKELKTDIEAKKKSMVELVKTMLLYVYRISIVDLKLGRNSLAKCLQVTRKINGILKNLVNAEKTDKRKGYIDRLLLLYNILLASCHVCRALSSESREYIRILEQKDNLQVFDVHTDDEEVEEETDHESITDEEEETGRADGTESSDAAYDSD